MQVNFLYVGRGLVLFFFSFVKLPLTVLESMREEREERS